MVIKSVPGKRALKLDRFRQEFHIFFVKMLQDFLHNVYGKKQLRKSVRQLDVIQQGGNRSECKKEVRNRYKKEPFCPTGGLQPSTGKMLPDSGLENWTPLGQNLEAANDVTC